MSDSYRKATLENIARWGFSWNFFLSTIKPTSDSQKGNMAFFKSFLVVPQMEEDSIELEPMVQTKKFAWSEFGAKLCGTLFGPCIMLLCVPIAPFCAMLGKTLKEKLLLLFSPLIYSVALPFMLIANLVDLLGSLVKTLIEVCQKDEKQNIAYQPM